MTSTQSGPATGNTWTHDLNPKGAFIRRPAAFRDFVRQDGGPYLAAENRYHLYVSLACPWAHRTTILRALKGLEQVLTVDVVHWFLDDRGWSFATETPGATGDTVTGAERLRDVYLAAAPTYQGRITTPVLYDRESQKIVNNESAEIIRMLNRELNEWAAHPKLDLYPDACRATIDDLNAWIYPQLNNGVYRAGFAQSQEAHDAAAHEVFSALDRMEEILQRQRWLAGESFSEADLRAFTTLVRFDTVYHCHFKCNLRRLRDYKAVWDYTREIYQHPLIEPTVDFFHIKEHYFRSHQSINPQRIVPHGPEIEWHEPHGRERLGGKAILA